MRSVDYGGRGIGGGRDIETGNRSALGLYARPLCRGKAGMASFRCSRVFRYGDGGPDGMLLMHPNTQEDLGRETQYRHDQREQPVHFDPPPSSWNDTSGIIQLRLKRRDFEPALGSSTKFLPQSSSEPGNISEIPCEDEGADRGAHAEDQRDVRENEEILKRGWLYMLHKIRSCFEED